MHEIFKSNRLIFVQLLLALLIFGTIASCSKQEEKAAEGGLDSHLLQYVPAGTPYLFTNPEPFPDDVMDKLEPGKLRDKIEAALKKAEEEWEESKQ